QAALRIFHRKEPGSPSAGFDATSSRSSVEYPQGGLVVNADLGGLAEKVQRVLRPSRLADIQPKTCCLSHQILPMGFLVPFGECGLDLFVSALGLFLPRIVSGLGLFLSRIADCPSCSE